MTIHKKLDEDEFLAVVAERDRLKAAILKHRGQLADDRCLDDDKELHAAIGDGIEADFRVGDKFEMLINCMRFVKNRCLGGGWPTYQELKNQRDRLLDMLGKVNGCLISSRDYDRDEACAAYSLYDEIHKLRAAEGKPAVAES